MTSRMRRSSRPPANSDRRPRGSPMAKEIVLETATIARGTRAPQMIRLKTSCPARSVPITNGPPGGSSVAPTFVFGSNGAMNGASIPITRIARMTARPIHTRIPATVLDCRMNVPSRRPTREVRPLANQPAMAPLVSDSWVNKGVQDIDAEAYDDHQDPVVDDSALDRRIVAVGDRIEHVPSHAFEREDGLR